MAQERSRVFGVVRGTVLTVVGLADAVQSQASQVLGGSSGDGRRSDTQAAPGGLQARGSRVVRRWATPPDNHMEVMAQRVARTAKASSEDA
jgi:hypothetical protein